MKLVEQEVERYAQHYARVARAVNVHWGLASREWKVWWALSGLLNLSKHCNDEHGKCCSYLHFAECDRPGPRYRPDGDDHQSRDAFFSSFIENPANPANIANIAMLMLDAWTTSASMRSYAFNSVLFGRTSANECLNNICAQWTLKANNSTVKMKKLGDACANMTKNEVLDYEHASAMLQQRKRGKGRVLQPRRPRRSRTLRWQLRTKNNWVKRKGRLAESNRFVAQQYVRLDKRKTRRTNKVQKLNQDRQRQLDDMAARERQYHSSVAKSTERTLIPTHSEESGVHYRSSGGVESNTGTLFVPHPLPQMIISFASRLCGDSSDEDAESSSSEEEEEQSQSQQQSQQQDDAANTSASVQRTEQRRTLAMAGLDVQQPRRRSQRRAV